MESNNEKARAILKYVEQIPALSPTVAKIMVVANDPNSTANDMNKVISLDPVLAAKVLKLVNSAYFGLPQKVNSTVRAIIMLGLNTIKNLALSTATLEGLLKHTRSGGMDINGFWRHCLAVSVCARLIAKKMQVQRAEIEDYFISGLLHDMGKIIINFYSPPEYIKAIFDAKKDKLSLLEVENFIFGINHCEVGKKLGEQWHLSDTLIDSMTNHHTPFQAKDYNVRHTCAIFLANTYSKVQQLGDSGNDYIPVIEDEVWKTTGLIEKDLLEIRDYLLEGLEKAQIFLQI